MAENEGHYQVLPPYSPPTDTYLAVIGLQRPPLSPTPALHVYDTAVMIVI